MIKQKQGNLLDAEEYFILHQVNCQGVMGSGIAKAVKEKWPEVFSAYRMQVEMSKGDHIFSPPNDLALLGTILPVEVPSHIILNGFGQAFYNKKGEELKRHSNYESIYQYLEATRNGILISDKPNTLAIPHRLGCGRGGANWEIVRTMIEQVFLGFGIDVTIYKFDE
jgi:Predicted phosphatase homologous to the C-terminal domain of histone macroH2A1